MKRWTKTFFAACAIALTLALPSFSPISIVLADEPVSFANNIPPDPSTLKPLPPPSPREQAVSALKKNASAKVAQIDNLRQQNQITDAEWRARLLKIREEVNAAKIALGLPMAPITASKLSSDLPEFTIQSMDYLSQMTYINQGENCKNGCGVAAATEVLDFEHEAYSGTDYTFDQVRQSLGLTCSSSSQGNGVCLGNYNPSIEHTLDVSGTATFEVHSSSSESGWFNDIVSSVTSWGYPQVMLTSPNYDGDGGVYLVGWSTAPSSSQHYIVVSGYNSTDGNVWYQDSAWWTAGSYWWYNNWVWRVNDNSDASAGCASPYKLIW